MRVAGTDPGTSSLDLVVLQDGAVADQARVTAEQLRDNPSLPATWLTERGPFDLVAGPSGYGLPVRPLKDCTDRDLALMTLVRPDQRGPPQGVAGLSCLLRTLRDSALPVVVLPGVIHLPTVPDHRKINRIDLGTADKLCVAALALHQMARRLGCGYDGTQACVVELGSAFTACVVLSGGRVVDGVGGTSGPCGWQSSGAWDGEAAYLLGPLAKDDLFTGGVLSVPDPAQGRALFREGLLRAVAGLKAVTPFEHILLSGRLLETEPQIVAEVIADLARLASVSHLDSLPGAWIKHAAQGAALLADGLAGGTYAPLVEHLCLREARGAVLDGLWHPRASLAREWFY
jgi:predicted butyrate kinase (DUF1464 family)